MPRPTPSDAAQGVQGSSQQAANARSSSGGGGRGEALDGEPLLGAADGAPATLSERAESGLRVVKHWGTCRCSPAVSGLCVAAVFAAIVGAVLLAHTLGRPPPRPPPPCGVWPDFIPCGRCSYGTMRPPHRVSATDTCDSIAQQYGVPQFDLFNRNRSLSCCEAPNISASDVIDFCRAPTLAQWRAAGHPRQLPPAGQMVASYVGATTVKTPGRAGEGLRSLPDSINVAYLAGVEDCSSSTGEFSLGVKRGSCGSLADNCSAQVEPTRTWRGVGEVAPNRVWLGSMVPIPGCCQQCNWGGGITPEEWGANAAASLEKIILRYRLDGLDLNIEGGKSNFGQYVCSLFKHLNQRMGPGLVYTLTPCCGLASM